LTTIILRNFFGLVGIPVEAVWSVSNFFVHITEKARIEAQVKAAEAAAQLKIDEEMRMKREQEREAARLTLHMVLPCPSFSLLFVTSVLYGGCYRIFNCLPFGADEENS
jgi:hypothetical protein